MTKNHKFFLAGIIFLALVVRVPGLFWGYLNFDFFEPDEYQYLGIARNLINQFDNEVVPDSSVTDQFNARALGVHMAVLGYPLLKIFNLPDYFLLAVGRIISLSYSLILVVLVFIVGRKIFNDTRIGLLAGSFLAVFDLNTTYSHYGVPDIMNVFWFYFSLYWIFWLGKGFFEDKFQLSLKELFLSTLGVALSISSKFQVVPLIIFLGLLFLFLAGPASRQNRVVLVITALCTITGVFYFSVGFDYNFHEFLKSKKELAEGALDIIQNGKHWHWLYNPLLYFMALIGGTSFLAVGAGLASVFYFFKSEKNAVSRSFVYLMTVALAMVFFFLWVGDGSFVRHANIFLPALALLLAWGCVKFYGISLGGSKIGKVSLIGGVILYTLLLTFFSQYYFVRDNRYAVADFIKNNFGDKKIAYSAYAKIKNTPPSEPLSNIDGADIVVMHETSYSRYYKSFTVPFKLYPDCCHDTYLCLPKECLVTQNILKGKTEYKLVKTFPVMNPLPERIVFKKLFGTYETFLGDVLIYAK